MVAKSAALDEFDRKILTVVQRDCSLTHEAIGQAVNLSASAVRRRLKVLRQTGVIEREIAVLRPEPTGLQLIVSICFKDESQAAYDALEARLMGDRWVQQVYAVSGDDDYVLVVHAPSPQAFDEWGRRILMSDPAIARYSTRVVWRRPKFDPSVQLLES